MAADVAEPGFGRRCDGSMWARDGSHGLTEASSECWSRRAETEANALHPTELRTSAASDQARPTTSFCLTRRLAQTDEPTIHESLNPDRRSGELLAGLISAATPRLAAALLLLP